MSSVCVATIVLAACGGGTGSQTTVPPGQQRALGGPVIDPVVDAAIDADVQGEDRAVLLRAGAALPLSQRKHLSRKGLFVVWLINKDHTLSTYANHSRMKSYAVALVPNPGTLNVYTDNGRIFAVPGLDPPLPVHLSSNGRAARDVVVQPNPGTGPYRRIISPPGYNYQNTDVALSCNPTEPSTDTGYVYLGGRGDSSPGTQTTGLPVEAGLQYGPVSGTWAPYMKIAGVTTVSGGDTFYVRDANIQQSDTSPSTDGRWHCSDPNQTNLQITFQATEYTDSTGTYSAWSMGTYEKADDFTDITFEVADFDHTYPYGGWSLACDGCVMIRTTSIAQPKNAENFGDGAYLGFINYSNAVLASYSSNGAGSPWPSNSLCEDYPAWSTTPQQECYSGPPPQPASPIITSNYTDQSNENVSIDLRPGGNGLSHSRNPH